MGHERTDVAVAVLDGQLYAVGGTWDGDICHSAECYDAATDTWRLVNGMSTGRSRHGVAVLDGRLYAVGGLDGTRHRRYALRSVERYDPATGVWEAVASMHKRRCDAGVAVLDGRLYAVGGYDGTTYFSSVERYDPATGAWEAVASMCKARSCHGVAAM